MDACLQAPHRVVDERYGETSPDHADRHSMAVLVLPLVFLRGFNSDDGVAVTIARTAIENGDWLTPHMFNVRFVERPTLLSWIIAAISLPFGIPTQVTARLPIILSVLGGALLIFGFLKPRVSQPAAVFGALLFLACPLVLRYYVTVTADLPLAVVLFAAFVLWWNAAEKHQLTITRWVVIGLVLAVAGLLKGPQPVGYFALGVGTFVLLTRRWAQIPGLILAGVVCATPMLAWYASSISREIPGPGRCSCDSTQGDSCRARCGRRAHCFCTQHPRR